jgi:hypothetical protein
MHYTCRGLKVIFPKQPQLHPDFRTTGKYANLIQQMLDDIEVGGKDEKTSLTTQFAAPIVPLAVNVTHEDRRIWGVHRYHTMRRPGLSPFIERAVSKDELGLVTIQILRLQNYVMLLRAYGGYEIKSLPWMKSQNPDLSMLYWHKNAFLARGHFMIKSSTTTPSAPDWYSPASVNS